MEPTVTDYLPQLSYSQKINSMRQKRHHPPPLLARDITKPNEGPLPYTHTKPFLYNQRKIIIIEVVYIWLTSSGCTFNQKWEWVQVNQMVLGWRCSNTNSLEKLIFSSLGFQTNPAMEAHIPSSSAHNCNMLTQHALVAQESNMYKENYTNDRWLMLE